MTTETTTLPTGPFSPEDRILLEEHLPRFAAKAVHPEGDSDQHLLTLFSIAQACKGKTYMELGVRQGTTTLPLLLAARLNGGHLYSCDLQPTEFECPEAFRDHWTFVEDDAIAFLESWDPRKKVDFIYLDDWHAYKHVARELELIDAMVGPSTVILVHDLMYGNHEPFYHSDIAVQEGQWAQGGPYRAVAELHPNFWEFSTLPWNNGLTLLRKKYSSKFHPR